MYLKEDFTMENNTPASEKQLNKSSTAITTKLLYTVLRKQRAK